MKQQGGQQSISIEYSIEQIQVYRNNFILSLLKDSQLQKFLSEQFESATLSNVKAEFLKRDLKILLSSSLDLVHYSPLIRQMKASSVPVDIYKSPLFLQEIKPVFQKYL